MGSCESTENKNVSHKDGSRLSEFLKHVGYGEQGEAEKMLQDNPLLATSQGDLFDCAGRRFDNITGFQYAVWALDFQMWRMLKQYLCFEDVRTQLE